MRELRVSGFVQTIEAEDDFDDPVYRPRHLWLRGASDAELIGIARVTFPRVGQQRIVDEWTNGQADMIPESDTACEISRAVVHPDYRKMGISSALALGALFLARRRGMDQVNAVMAHNCPNRGYLRDSLGFTEETDELSVTIQEHPDIVVPMMLNLTQQWLRLTAVRREASRKLCESGIDVSPAMRRTLGLLGTPTTAARAKAVA